MTHCSLAILLALVRRRDIGGAIRPWMLRLERKKRWLPNELPSKPKLREQRRRLI